jgi:dTDP-D-glucose 4,6-dehydratase
LRLNIFCKNNIFGTASLNEACQNTCEKDEKREKKK